MDHTPPITLRTRMHTALSSLPHIPFGERENIIDALIDLWPLNVGELAAAHDDLETGLLALRVKVQQLAERAVNVDNLAIDDCLQALEDFIDTALEEDAPATPASDSTIAPATQVDADPDN